MAVRRLRRVLVAGIPLGGVSVLYFARKPAFFALAVALVGCSKSAAPPAAATDDFGDSVRVGRPPSRIVSLSPATTEILFTLGAGPRLVGRTKYDLWPDSAKLIPSVGDGIRPNVEAVLAVHPDLVVIYASQDNRPAATRLRAAGVNTLAVRGDHIAEFRRVVRLLGAIIGDSVRAKSLADSVYHTLDSVRTMTSRLSKPTVFWHVWDAPVITIGGGSFMNDLVDIAGGRNVYADIKGPSGNVSLEDVSRRDPDVILAGPVGKRQIESDPRWQIVRAVREGRIFVVDTGVVARPSVRLGEAAVLIANLLHPGMLR
ncbi:MAG: ABC transporter substrate-binding protein [Gemmatimonadaceae bacterium]